MEKIKIITDSTCDLPKEVIEELDIEVVPLLINVNYKSYRDNVDITPSELNKIIEESEDFPITSQVNPDVFKDVYEKYLTKGYKIISIHISSKLSNTCQSAFIAKDILDTNDIRIYDSLSVCGGVAILVTEAANMVKQGFSLDEICKSIEESIPKIKCCVIINDLRNLMIAGRVNRTLGLFLRVLGVKPVLSLVGGEIVILDKIRSTKNIFKCLSNFLYDNNVTDNSKIYLVYNMEDTLLQTLKNLIDNKGFKYYSIHIGCVISAYSGGRCIGLFIKND